MENELLEALEEYAESCIRTGHTDIEECAAWFIEENDLDGRVFSSIIENELARIMFPNSIKHLRLQARMTQKQFAEFVGCSKRAIEEWEGCRRTCPSYVIKLIAYKLKNENLLNKKGDAD